MARRLQFVTAHARKGEALDLDWSALADPGATLAVYMGKFAASDVARQLIAAGMPSDTPARVNRQRVVLGKRWSVRVEPGVLHTFYKTTQHNHTHTSINQQQKP